LSGGAIRHRQIAEPRVQPGALRDVAGVEALEGLDDTVPGQLVRCRPLREVAEADGGAGQIASRSQRPGGRHGLLGHLAPTRPLSRQPVGLAEGQQGLEAALRIDALAVLEGVVGLLVVERRLLVGVEPDGLIGGPGGELVGALGVAHGDAAVVVMGELGDHRVEGAGVTALDPLGRPLVQARSLARGEPVVDRFLEERVGELEVGDAFSRLGDDARAQRLVEECHRGAALDPGHGGHLGQRELPPQDGARAQQLRALG
jgi:hypothetical protein